jgi:hypothetical protein
VIRNTPDMRVVLPKIGLLTFVFFLIYKLYL